MDEKVLELLQSGGYDWEQKVVEEHLCGRVRIAPGDSPLTDRHFTTKAFLELLPSLKDGDWVYQPSLQPGKLVHERFQLNEELLEFPACRPDLLHYKDGHLTIVDVKASEALKASHRVQVAFYALILELILQQAQSEIRADRSQGGVWLYETDQPEFFSLGPSLTILERFLESELEPLLAQELSQAFWHLTPSCEWCEFLPHCREEAVRTKHVAQVPGLTPGGGRFLRDQLSIGTMPELYKVLERGNTEKLLAGCGSLQGRARRLRKAVQSLLTNKVMNHGGSSPSLPVREDIRLILTVQKEPVSGRIYAAGFHRQGGANLFGQEANIWLETASAPEECGALQASFLRALFSELRKVHDHNGKLSYQDRLTLHVYSYDNFEQALFEQLLMEHLHNPEYTRLATRLMLYFQNETVADSKHHPSQEVPHPLVSLESLIREMLVLPEAVNFQLQSALKHLAPEGMETQRFREKFHYQFNGALKASPILRVWESGESRGLGQLKREMLRRLEGCSELLDYLRLEVSAKLFTQPRRFQFPGFRQFRHFELSRLSFVARYEALSAARAIRRERARPYLERVQSGVTISLAKLDESKWKVLSRLVDTHFDDGGGFLSFLLSPVGAEGDKAQMAFDDFREKRSFNCNVPLLQLAGIKSKRVDEDSSLVVELELKTDQPERLQEIPVGARYHLNPRFTDFTTDQQLNSLAQWDELPGGLLFRLLREPHKLDPTGEATPSCPEGLTHSQRRALNQVWTQTLTLVWGPPGTGKTHFIVEAIRSFLSYRNGFRIGVTAFTHAAVENVLSKFVPLNMDCPVKKIRRVRSEGSGIESIGLKAIKSLSSSFLVGGTVYDFAKAMKNGLPDLDLLIVDEASQMKWGELSLALGALKRGGRLMLAGDDLQLPPILAGTYPSTADEKPGLEDSIFAYLRSRDIGEQKYTCQLLECWRMNRTLCQFAAETLYGEEFRPATSGLADQKLELDEGPHALDALLSPEYPLVVCILENVQAAQENLVEAALVADLCCQIRSRTDSSLDDQRFWKEKLFVVSPHHLQIRAIRSALAERRNWNSKPFVDTVDKMQGQEAECVIVSYGVSDRETALMEAEFLYSLNRLNVSVTRARSKCIVFLPRPLLTPSFELLNTEKAVEGLGHMLNLVRYCQTHGEKLVPESGPEMTVWRASV